MSAANQKYESEITRICNKLGLPTPRSYTEMTRNAKREMFILLSKAELDRDNQTETLPTE